MSRTRLPRLKSLCVFCGSSPGGDPRHREAAGRLGRAMAAEGIKLVYGGGQLGLMGALAEAVMGGGGQVVGVMPEHLTRVEKAYDEITELHVVDSMHTRKRMMFDMADAFAVLPGGMGTMDETFEILTWKQLRLHNKPILIVNQHGYWQPWLDMAGHIIGSGFARPETEKLYAVVDDVDAVLPMAQAGLAHQVEGRPGLF
ncbi:MAG TPA: TIGR00730 family Rossman fold protein [Candidatus Omnitrophota bacterium]|nr:TIGR00730 family Rossman fold protein [Candidatus Omnitrophota bacterium]